MTRNRFHDPALFRNFVAANPGMRIERTHTGEAMVLPPAHARSGHECADIVRQLGNWAVRDGSGIVFDSSAGFELPNGSNRSPDVAWVLVSRLQALSKEDLDEYPPLCPDFVVEVGADPELPSFLLDFDNIWHPKVWPR